MRGLTEFNPEWNGVLRPRSGEGFAFDCPVCGSIHRLQVFFSNPLDGLSPAPWQKPTWKRIGDTFEALTIEPSIQYTCFHGWIEDGQVIDVSESPMRGVVMINGEQRIVSLSPRQAKALAAIRETQGGE